MFDHRIAEDHVERSVSKGELTAVGKDPSQRAARFDRAGKIEDRDLRLHGEQGPVSGRSTNVENARVLVDLQEPLESGHTRNSKAAHECVQYRAACAAPCFRSSSSNVSLLHSPPP